MQSLSLKQLEDLVMQLAKDKGFGVKLSEINVLEKIALVHSEISEALEAYRHKRMKGQDGFGEELADAIIRIFHLAGACRIDLEKEILKKLKHNKNREWKWEDYNETHS